ncbi:phage tail protein [Vibrio sp. 03-59-1]|uniref:phage tail protein n=1 Tax=Vibrio sp. 03-59-1 TaxID=2607607 RepID=UPI0014937867|nr:phage tail protein [Vibrio sp. 03-59-1]NOH85536.1 phage tail protein [Vibrio sp. 03-59-1]
MSEQSEPYNSVQPNNRTIIEESLEFAWDKVLSQTQCPFPSLKNPMLCPDGFVSLLAAERGVLDWQPGDTLEQQRETTDKAFEIHSKAGTRYGLSNSINALGFKSKVERGELPYSIKASAEIEKGKLDEALQARLESRVNTYKSERDTVELQLVRSSDINIYTGVMCEVAVINDSEPYGFNGIDASDGAYTAVIFETHIYSESHYASINS